MEPSELNLSVVELLELRKEEFKMTVKELMDKLSKCSPDAIVCVEANRDPRANEVQEYVITDGSKNQVYIADELDYIDEVILGKRI
jgi:hypothetical protein